MLHWQSKCKQLPHGPMDGGPELELPTWAPLQQMELRVSSVHARLSRVVENNSRGSSNNGNIVDECSSNINNLKLAWQSR